MVILQCIDINTLEPVWIANVYDDIDATIVLEETDKVSLYIREMKLICVVLANHNLPMLIASSENLML